MTGNLQKILKSKHISVSYDNAKKVKEASAVMATNYEKEYDAIKRGASDLESYHYSLPDGTQLFLEEERIKSVECLFNPSMVGKYDEGLKEALTSCFSEDNNIDFMPLALENLILSGGNTKIKGFKQRLHKEIMEIVPRKSVIRIHDRPDKEHLSWLGGSVITSLASFNKMWITKDDYDEIGPSIVHRKCL